MSVIDQLVEKAREDGASDIHLICGLPPKYRKDGQLEDMFPRVLTAEDCEHIAHLLAGDSYREMAEIGELDLADTYAGSRCRVHIFRQQGVPSVALRLLREKIPDLTTLGLPPAALELPNQHKGIILVTGETGSGKSTTLAAMLDYINHHRKSHIVTLEDPIEYLYKPDLCAINQREIGKDTRSFADGLRASLREDPNVILIGEMRDAETIETAITAAETGHLVFGTLHCGSASDAVDRIVQVFPEGMQPHDAIRNLIRAGNTPQIANAIATSSAIGGQTMDQALVRLVRSGQITRDMALQYAHDRAFVQKNAI